MLNVGHLNVSGNVQVLIREMLTEKLQNHNGFFTTHGFAPFLNSNMEKGFSFNFLQQHRSIYKHQHAAF